MKFQDKFRIESARLQNYDYSSNGAYFITICTKNRENYFGEIINKKIQLTPAGTIAKKYWIEIPKIFPFIKLDEFVIMPDHMHGIIIIDNTNTVETPNLGVSLNNRTVQQPNLGVSLNNRTVQQPNLGVSLNNRTVQQPNLGVSLNNRTVQQPNLGVSFQDGLYFKKIPKFSPTQFETPRLGVSTGLGTIINQYKRICTIKTKQINPNFAWQSRFHDRVIRNEHELQLIREYIINNPAKF